MGFRKNAYAKVWTVELISDTLTKCRISISRKDRNTGDYVQDFGGYVTFVGSAAAQKAAKLHEGDRIQLGDVDVSNVYVKEKGVTYTNFKAFSFLTQDEIDSANGVQDSQGTPPSTVGDGEIDDELLPF